MPQLRQLHLRKVEEGRSGARHIGAKDHPFRPHVLENVLDGLDGGDGGVEVDLWVGEEGVHSVGPAIRPPHVGDNHGYLRIALDEEAGIRKLFLEEDRKSEVRDPLKHLNALEVIVIVAWLIRVSVPLDAAILVEVVGEEVIIPHKVEGINVIRGF